MERLSILLVAKPGPLGDALANLLGAVPQAHLLWRAETGLLALKLVREAMPALVVIASSIADKEALELVHQIKHTLPKTQCVVLVETTRQSEQMVDAGADGFAFSHISAMEFMATIQRRLQMLTDENIVRSVQVS